MEAASNQLWTSVHSHSHHSTLYNNTHVTQTQALGCPMLILPLTLTETKDDWCRGLILTDHTVPAVVHY